MNFWAASEFYFSFPPQLILHLGQKGAKKQEMASNRLQSGERKKNISMSSSANIFNGTELI